AVLETQRHGHRLPFEVGMRAREREAERRSPREVHDAAARHPAEFALRACLRSVEALELCGLVGQVAIHGESLLEARVPALEQLERQRDEHEQREQTDRGAAKGGEPVGRWAGIE